MALLPLAWLVWRQVRGHRSELSWWLLAGAFGVSWIADTAAHVLSRDYNWVPSLTYPVLQTAVIAFVLLPRRTAAAFATCLIAVALIVILADGAEAPDLVLRSVAWLSIIAMVWLVEMPTRLRACLIVSFGVGLALWMAVLRWPIAATWYVYQINRLIGLLLFCWAASYEQSAQHVPRQV